MSEPLATPQTTLFRPEFLAILQEVNTDCNRYAHVHNLLSGVRGPDAGLTAGIIQERNMLKSVTAVIIRRAIYGAAHAERFSHPSAPHPDRQAIREALKTSRSTLGPHFMSHANMALEAAQILGLVLPEDMELVDFLLHEPAMSFDFDE